MLGLMPPMRRGRPCCAVDGRRPRRTEVSMGRVLAIAAMLTLLGAGPSGAQMSDLGATPTPGAGTTSSLGTIDLTSPVGGSGIPLGSSELFAGGLSPAPLGPIDSTTTCPNMTM